MRLSGRLSALERNGHARPVRDVTIYELAGILRRLLTGVWRGTILPAYCDGVSPEQLAAIDAAENHLAKLDDAAVIELVAAYAKHVKSGREDLPSESFGCPPPADFHAHAEIILSRMRQGLYF